MHVLPQLGQQPRARRRQGRGLAREHVGQRQRRLRGGAAGAEGLFVFEGCGVGLVWVVWCRFGVGLGVGVLVVWSGCGVWGGCGVGLVRLGASVSIRKTDRSAPSRLKTDTGDMDGSRACLRVYLLAYVYIPASGRC